MPRKVTKDDVRIAYQRLFMVMDQPSDIARLVLGDLLKVTGGLQDPTQRDDTGKVDMNATLLAIGMQNVWRHIDQMLNLPSSTSMGMLKDAILVGVDHDRHDE